MHDVVSKISFSYQSTDIHILGFPITYGNYSACKFSELNSVKLNIDNQCIF